MQYILDEAGEACKYAEDISFDEFLEDALIKITTFNLKSRYPDEKRSFKKKCTKEFTKKEI